MSNRDIDKVKLTVEDILKAIKRLTPGERKIIEKELVLMRLEKEFVHISDKLEERRKSRKREDAENV